MNPERPRTRWKDDIQRLAATQCMTTDRMYHSCEENLLYAKNLARYVRIGLPDCKIIQDIKSHTSTSNLGNISVEDYCTDRTEDGTELVRICTSDFQICKFAQCVHKCCPDGFSFVNGSHCHPTFIHGLDLNFSESIQRNETRLITDFARPVHHHNIRSSENIAAVAQSVEEDPNSSIPRRAQ
ncbi:hypothetical protein YQE_10441, partial [Dendroctonus ponderosae]